MRKIKWFSLVIGIFMVVLVLGITKINTGKSMNKIENDMPLKSSISTYSESNSDFIYLSDIRPITSNVGYKVIAYDTNVNGGNISLMVDGTQKYFIKGVAAHATSTVIYDLKDYNYDIFTAYLGMDASVKDITTTDGAKFYIYVSNDNINWTEKYASDKAYKAAMNAVSVSIDISGYQYLKLYCHQVGNNWNDYATYANAKLTKSDYVEDNQPATFIKTIEEYDQIIKNYPIESDISAYELTLLQRTFVKNVGYDMLQALCQYSGEYKNTLKWLMEDKEVLNLYLTGGKPDGAYTNSIKILSDLYTKHGNDLKDTTIDSVSGVKNGEVYQKMMISLSLTHARKIHFWQDTTQVSDPVVRYEVFKDLRSKDLVEKNIFDTVPIVDMRLIFNSMISDEQIPWLNYYVRLKGNKMSPYDYIKYTGDYNYNEEQYYSAENYDKWNQKYELSKFNIPYESGHPKIWVIFEEGSVCGGLSKTGTNLNTTKGIPALVLGQPGHAAYMVYSKTADGKGKWDLGNDVFGWAESHWTYEGNVATGWGTEAWAGPHPASATLLTQAALNDLENYEKAEKLMYLARVYKDQNSKDYSKLEQIYNLAIDTQKINYDAWKALFDLYIEDTSKTEADYLLLAHKASDALTYYPFPMYYLVERFNPYIKTDAGKAEFNLLKKDTLTKATLATAGDTVQPNYSISLAKYLLGKTDLSIASFSFDGENAGKIILSSKFENSETRLKYSLDGGTTWNETDAKEVMLTQEQIESINVTDDIIVGLVGSDANQIIDITEANKPSSLYNNDLENRVISATNAMEWSFDENTWTSFASKAPDLTGNVTVYVRVSSKGTVKASLPVSLKYTAETINYHQMYIPIEHLSISEASSNQPGAIPENVIDGNIYTMWHTKWDNSDTRNFITIKLDEPTYVSALQYVPRQSGSNGMIRNGKVMVSLDGVEWKEAATITNWAYTVAPKTVVFGTPTLASYVKLIGTTTGGNYVSATMINLFKDDTLLPKAQIDNTQGTFDLYRKGDKHKELGANITRNSETVKSVSIENKIYDLAKQDEKDQLSKILNFEETQEGYKVTILSSWLSTLTKGEYRVLFTTNQGNLLTYQIDVIDTYTETNRFESNNSIVSIELTDKLDATFKLKVEELQKEGEALSKFIEYLKDKDILRNYEISIFDENTKVNYDKSIRITLNVGISNANKKVTVLHEKNGKIEEYTVTSDENGKISFNSLTGLSQFVVITDIEPKPEEPKPEEPKPEEPKPEEPKPEEPAPEEPTPEEPAPEEPKPEEPTPEEPTPEKPTPDKPTPDKPTPDKPTSDKSTPNKPTSSTNNVISNNTIFNDLNINNNISNNTIVQNNMVSSNQIENGNQTSEVMSNEIGDTNSSNKEENKIIMYIIVSISAILIVVIIIVVIKKYKEK